MSLLEVENLTRRFGRLQAVRDVSLSVERGELRAIIGPNGAGKTTFFNLVSGLLPPTSGHILLDGRDVTALPPHRRVALGVGRTFQVTEIFPELTVRENLRIASEVTAGYGRRLWMRRDDQADIRARVHELIELGGLVDRADRLVGELSHGDQRSTEIMMSIALSPQLLLLDEPTAGMSDQETYEIASLVRRLHRERNLTVVLIEHDMRVIFHLADRITVLSEGCCLAEGTPDEIAGNEQVQTAYLGERRMNALEAEGLHTFYGKSHILHGIDLCVGEGQIVAVLGRNGAGKTTTLRSLMGLTPPRQGAVRILGHTTTRWPPFRVAALGVGYVPEGRRIFANLTVHENLKVPLERPGSWDLDRVYRHFPRLAERRGNRGNQLSGGEQEMLAIARALLLNPRLLLLDEPSQGLAPTIVQEVFRIIREMRQEGMSVLLVEQNVRAAVAVADVAYVLDDGRVVHAGPARDLAADSQRVRELAGAGAGAWGEG